MQWRWEKSKRGGGCGGGEESDPYAAGMGNFLWHKLYFGWQGLIFSLMLLPAFQVHTLETLEAGGAPLCGTCRSCDSVRHPDIWAKHFLALFPSFLLAGGAGQELSRLPCITGLNRSFQILSLRSTFGNHCLHVPRLDKVLGSRLCGIRYLWALLTELSLETMWRFSAAARAGLNF